MVQALFSPYSLIGIREQLVAYEDRNSNLHASLFCRENEVRFRTTG